MKDFANLLLDEFMSATSNNGSGGAAFIVAVAAERPSLWADADLLILDVVIWWRWSPEARFASCCGDHLNWGQKWARRIVAGQTQPEL